MLGSEELPSITENALQVSGDEDVNASRIMGSVSFTREFACEVRILKTDFHKQFSLNMFSSTYRNNDPNPFR